MKLFDAAKHHGSRRSALAVAATLALVALFACQGDTLYDAPPQGVPEPTVTISDPTAGLQILAGKPLHVTVTASDTLGISQLQVRYSGAENGSFIQTYTPARASVQIDTAIATRAGTSGVIDLEATAINQQRGTATATPVKIEVAAVDTVRPFVSLDVAALPARLEVDDSITAIVTATDNRSGSGIALIGLSVVVVSSTRGDTLISGYVFTLPQIEPNATGVRFDFVPPFADERSLPDDMTLEFHAFAVDSAGNCSAAIQPQPQRLVCLSRSLPSGSHTLAETRPASHRTLVVAGRSTSLPGGSAIADAVADVPRGKLYMSNRSLGRIEVLDIRNNALLPNVRVGSEPWGIALNRSADTLIVANSGSASISFVTLNGSPSENLSRRYQTLNATLMELLSTGRVGDTESDSLGIEVHDFADRPQFVAQDHQGRLLYSTIATQSRPAALRIVRHQPGWSVPEVQLLRGPEAIFFGGDIAVANIDSARTNGAAGCLELFDHANGSPTTILRSSCTDPATAVANLASQNSDIYWRAGTWNLDDIEFADPTFVAASADRLRIVFGEGAVATGRIRLWKSDSSDVSNEITMEDLVGNGAEQILDVQMNPDGTLGMARGMSGAYTFKRDLRLQGFVRPGVTAARSGAVLHPQHPSFPTYGNLPASNATTVMFVDAGDAIGIYDTVHYTKRGEIPIRDAVVGPLRVSRPLPTDTQNCAPEDCVVAKLYAVTTAGAVVVINVRGRDIS